MRILFIYTGAESLGVEYLAAGARAAGHEVDLAPDPALYVGHVVWKVPVLDRFLDQRPKIVGRVLRERPDVAAFSCFTCNYPWSLSIAEEIKSRAPEVRTVFGGVHVSSVPGRVIAEPAVDALIAGEADEAFPELLCDWEEGRHMARAGVWEKQNGEIVRGGGALVVDDPDSLPFPDKELFYKRFPVMELQYEIMTARGCPYKCSYCYCSLPSSTPAGAKPVRRRSVENVIAELERAVARGRVRRVFFRDDIFTLREEWLEEFAEQYCEKIALPYYCLTHPAAVNERVADLIRRSGCVQVNMGVQSADEQQRSRVLNRNYTNERVRRSVGLLKERGVNVSLDHIIGLPGDTVPMIEKAAAFYNELRPARLQVFWLTYYPGTAIVRIAREMGCLSEEDQENIESGTAEHRVSGMDAMGPDPLFKKLYVLLFMIPLLPRGIVNRIIRSKAYRWFPGPFWLSNLPLFLNSVRLRDAFFFHALRFLITAFMFKLSSGAGRGRPDPPDSDGPR